VALGTNIDDLVDTVGVTAAACALGVTAVWPAPLALGSGSVTMAHGRYPAPAPGTRHRPQRLPQFPAGSPDTE
jgi:pyridinium-3,5-bisthiocarboxylic acid mononucleotide nickel chelatase